MATTATRNGHVKTNVRSDAGPRRASRLTVDTVDTLQNFARRLQAASLAVGALGTSSDHGAVAELVFDLSCELRAFTEK